MSAIALVQDLMSGGVIFETDGEKLRWRNGNGKITPDVVAEMKEGKAEIIAFLSRDQRHTGEGQKREEPLSFSHPKQQNERRRVIPFPGRDWKPDTKIRPDDPDRYADALRVQGPASYGMMMRILGWGGTRAGRAEDELQKQGRITFDNRGFAVLTDRAGE